MANTVPDKNIEIGGKTVGASSTIKLSVKTAMWLIGAIVGVVMTILTWSYFDLKADVKAFQDADAAAQKEFIGKVDEKLDTMDDDVDAIRIDQADIKGDIRLILDRQTRDNPVRATNRTVESTTPPPGE